MTVLHPGKPLAPISTGRNTRRYAILGVLFGLAFPLIATMVSIAYARLPWTAGSIATVHSQPLMWIIDTAPIFLGGFAALAGRWQDALEAGKIRLEEQARELSQNQSLLEQRNTERTRELEELGRQMRAAVATSRKIAQIRDLAPLTKAAVQLIAESLSEFAIDLYLIDQRTSEAVLSASSQEEDAPADSVRVGDASLIGQVAASGEAARVTSSPDGPQLAFPLVTRGRPLGVLNLRATSSLAQFPPDPDVFQLLADQVASAIETSRLFSEARAALQQLQALSDRSTQSVWQQGGAIPAVALEFTPTGVAARPPASISADVRSFRVPLVLRGHRIGTIALRRPGSEGWTELDRDLAHKTAAQVALALENARLFEETQERALQEQRLSEFSARLNQSVDLDTLLQAAVRELATLPGVSDASIYFTPSAPAVDGEPS